MMRKVKPPTHKNIHVRNDNTFLWSLYWMLPCGLGSHIDDKAKWDERMKAAVEEHPGATHLLEHHISGEGRTSQATTTVRDGDGAVAICFFTDFSDATIVHEVVHAVAHVGRHIGIPFCEPTEEWFSYTIAAIVRDIQQTRT